MSMEKDNKKGFILSNMKRLNQSPLRSLYQGINCPHSGDFDSYRLKPVN
jgi:hypothetical protein